MVAAAALPAEAGEAVKQLPSTGSRTLKRKESKDSSVDSMQRKTSGSGMKRQTSGSGEVFALPGSVRTCVFEATSGATCGSNGQRGLGGAGCGHGKGRAELAAAAAMEGWRRTRLRLPVGDRLLTLYLFAFWSQFKPSEPFLVDYLLDAKGLTQPQVYQQIFDLFIYTRLPCVALVGLVAGQRWGGTRRVLVAGAACGLVTVLLTRFGQALWCQQLAEFTVAAAFASRVCCPAVAFAIAEPEQYQESVHTLKAVMLLSNFFSAAVGEVLRDFAGAPLSFLFDLSAVGQAISLFLALSLPQWSSPQEVEEALDYSIVEGSSGHTEDCDEACRDRPATCKSLMGDLCSSLLLRRVAWWTAWALWMNPVHGLAITYWQGLVRSKNILSDHNGALLAIMYLFAAIFTFASGNAAALRNKSACLVISTMLGAGLLLVKVVDEYKELQIYFWLLLYQCLFEVTTAICTFQVGDEVTRSVAATFAKPGAAAAAADAKRMGHAANGDSPGRKPSLLLGAGLPAVVRDIQTARLTILFSATAIASGANENLILLVTNRSASMDLRFDHLGWLLVACAGALALARCLEATMPSRVASARRLAAGKDAAIEPLLSGDRDTRGQAC